MCSRPHPLLNRVVYVAQQVHLTQYQEQQRQIRIKINWNRLAEVQGHQYTNNRDFAK